MLYLSNSVKVRTHLVFFLLLTSTVGFNILTQITKYNVLKVLRLRNKCYCSIWACADDPIVISHCCLFLFALFFFFCEYIYCAAVTKRTREPFIQSEGKQGLIDIDIFKWRLLSVVCRLKYFQHFHHFSYSHRRKGLLFPYWWKTSAKPRSLWQLITFSSLLSFHLYHSWPPLCLVSLILAIQLCEWTSLPISF